ncbi:phosphotransferase family protein [Streptomyces griseus]|uniref:phosphotransferase family protein n=1 Tax=Streptomyces griseus TaxID=1911 RepID=UPI001F263904|nr:aminoglycoside phosphotransferase family protein [Streptomyces griseus]
MGVGLAVLLGAMPLARLKYRVPLETIEVVPRIWAREADVLDVVCRYLSEVPRCLAVLGERGERSLHAYLAGKALSERNPDGAVDDQLMRAFAAFFVRTAQVPAHELPERPDGWPQDGDSEGFLDWLIDFAEHHVHRPNRHRFGRLFDDVGIPEEAMEVFRKEHRGLTPRPFRLLHTDVHRANVIVRGEELAVIDWELATFGDPLHDLATHMVRMGYDAGERARMTELWAQAMLAAGCGDLTKGMEADLPVYVDFEYAQSVFTDVMRAALALPSDPQEEHFRSAARRVTRALELAQRPLGLARVRGAERVVTALRDWHGASVVSQ